MDDIIQTPNVLHLHGVTIDDFVSVEDVFEKRVLEELVDEPLTDIYPRDVIPRIFTSIETWPQTTNLRCWSCAFTFESRPCFIPTFIRKGKKSGIEIGVEGNFCSFNCAARYMIMVYPPQGAFADKHWNVRNNLHIVCSMFAGHPVTHITPAPHMTAFREFGGEMSKEEFRFLLQELDAKARRQKVAILPETVEPAAEQPPLSNSNPNMWSFTIERNHQRNGLETPCTNKASSSSQDSISNEMVVPESPPEMDGVKACENSSELAEHSSEQPFHEHRLDDDDDSDEKETLADDTSVVTVDKMNDLLAQVYGL